jgi:hypothetical protein
MAPDHEHADGGGVCAGAHDGWFPMGSRSYAGGRWSSGSLLRVRNWCTSSLGGSSRRVGRASERGHGLLADVQKEHAVRDLEDAREVVAHHDDRGAEAVPDLEDQVVEAARGDRIESGGWLVEEEHLRIERHGTGQGRALAHPTADLDGPERLEAAKPHQREFQRNELGDGLGAEVRVLLER